MFANDKIRLHYWIPMFDDDYVALYSNDDPKPYEKPSKKKLRTSFFRRQSDFYAFIKANYDDDLRGMKNSFALFHSRENLDPDKYNGWNFDSTYWWDSIAAGFWYAK